MKRAVILILSILAALCLSACGAAPVAKPRTTAERGTFFSAEKMEKELTDFVSAHRDRTTFSDNERAAADYIADRLREMGYREEDGTLALQSFDVEVTVQSGLSAEKRTLSSRNVIASLGPGGAHCVIVGAGYDNLYSAIDDLGSAATGDEGAMNNGTGVAALLDLAEALRRNAPDPELNIKLVFFGASAVGAVGSSMFLREGPCAASDIDLMVSLSMLASDEIGLYSDETDTPECDYFMSLADGYGAKFESLPRSIPLIPQKYCERLEYSHVGLMGDHIVFFDSGVPVVSLLGGDFDGVNYFSAVPDTLESFTASHPGFGLQLAESADLVYRAITAEGFAETAASFREGRPDYSFFMNSGAARFILLGVLVALGIILFLVVKHYEKKALPQGPPTRPKIAVFGPDFEDPPGRKEGEKPENSGETRSNYPFE